MIHLFDKVYVTYAEKFVGPQDESRMPEAFARIINKGLTYIEDRNYDKHLLCDGKNLKEVIDKFENENDMFLKFKEILDSKFSPKFIIYCDENAMLELLVRWWKYVFPNLTPEAGYSLYNNFAENQTIRGLRDSTFLNISKDSSQANFNDFSHLYWSESKEIFKDKFNSYPAFELSPDFKKSVCIEFQILNYMTTGVVDENIQKKLQDFFNKSLIDEITSIIEDCQDNIYFLDDKSEFYFSEDKPILKLLEKNSYKILQDKNVKNNMEGFSHLQKNYEFLKVCKDLLSLNTKIGKNEEVSRFDYPCIYHIVEKGLDIDFSEILENQINSTDNLNLLNNLIHKTRLNSYLIPAIKNRIDTKGKDEVVLSFKF